MLAGRWSPSLCRGTARLALAGLLGTALGGPVAALTPRPALAAGTTIFDQPFVNNTIASAYPVSLPGRPSGATGTNTACLTARGNTGGTGPRSCSANTDANGLGALRPASNSSTFQQGGVFGATSAPTGSGLDVTFNSFQYGGSSGNDGIAFVVAAVDPADPVPPATMGRPGGGLGYSANRTGPLPGLANAYLGIGLDVSGNYSNGNHQGGGCANPPYISTTGPVPGQVVVRGPGNGTTGYCAINSTATTTTSPALALHADSGNRADALIPVEVVINPTAAAFTTHSGLSVAAGTYKVVFTPIGGAPRTLTGTLPSVSPSLYPSPTWLDANGVPRQLAFGWVSSTGGSTDLHEINTAKVVTFDQVPKLTVTQTSFNGASPRPGDPVTYTTVAGVAAGNTETSPISITQTTPSGVVPVGAFGSGWVCGSPSGQSITCTNSGTPFTAGTSPPPITVVAIVTGTGVTPSLIQSSSTATASSADADPGIATSTTAGTVPPAPSGITVTPSTGTVAGGAAVTLRGGNVVGANAIEIGTTAEQQAGTPVVLPPCASGPAAGCFTDNGDGSLSISSMPSRATAATVTITVAGDGIAGAASYVYTSAPSAPAAPTATAGPGSATVGWTAPAANGSPITGYVVTPYIGGVAQPPQTFTGTATTQRVTGLTPGTAYTFTVTAQNAAGSGPPSGQSTAVTPNTAMTETGSPTVNDPPVTTSITSVTSSPTPGTDCPTGGTDPACRTSVAIDIPQLTITETANVATVTPGGTVRYTVTVENTGPTSYTGATFTDSLAGVLTDAVYDDDVSATSGTAAYTEPNVTWTGDLSPGDTATITYSVTVKNPDPGDKVPVNAVTSTTLNNNCPVGGTDPACKVTVRVLVPQLTITKSAGAATIVAGGRLTYTITVANTGETPYTGAALTDDLSGVLDEATYDNDAVASTGSLSYTAPNLGWTGDLGLAQTATITYSVTVHNPTGGDGTLTNTITSATPGNNCPVASTDIRCATATQAIAQAIALSDVTGTFTLTGTPGSTPQDDGAVTMTVVSNGPGGYTVGVTGTDLRSATTGDTIPISALRVRERGTSAFHALSDTTPVTAHAQNTPSAENGDTFSNDYQAEIPFVPPGRYTATLDYIATTQ